MVSMTTAEPFSEADMWDHDMWCAAWRRNATRWLTPLDCLMPSPPDGRSWLAKRILVGGRKMIELSLIRTADLSAVSSVRCPAETDQLLAAAQSVLRESKDLL